MGSSASSTQSHSSSIPIQSSSGSVPSSYSSGISIQSSVGTSSFRSLASSRSSSSSTGYCGNGVLDPIEDSQCEPSIGYDKCFFYGFVCDVSTCRCTPSSTSSSYSSSSCPGDLCSGPYDPNGDEICASIGLSCEELSEPPCARCIGGSSSSIIVQSSATSTSSTSSTLCPGDLCSGPYDPNGDSVCASYGLLCEELSEPPCARCIGGSSSSIIIVQSSATSTSSSPTSPGCGNGLLDAGEECDDSNWNDGDGCDDLCRIETGPWCGNDVLDLGEQCDDGNWDDGDGCSRFCRDEATLAPRCGDGFLDPGEECDDGNPRNGDYCSVLCRWEGLERCANNIIEPPEQCDDGNTRDGDGCSRFCRTEQILGGPLCGDGLLDPGEECDDGNTGPEDGCDAWCRWEGFNRCGNHILEWGEQCDDGNLFNSDGCSTLCQREQTAPLSSCGDGRRAKTEQCDDGNPLDGDGCDRGCRIESFSAAAALLCGDGLRDVGEECDDGNLSNGDGCSSHCLFEQGRCGDSTVQRALGEQCEPSLHNASLPYGCTSTCRFLHRECGNGIPNLGEECDSGPLNSNLPDAPCRPDCSLPHCGDIVLDPVEFCDDGNLLRGDGCDEYCRRESDLFPQYSSTSSLPSLRPAASLTRTSDQAHPPLFATLQTFEPWRRGSTVRVPTHAPAGETGPAAMAVMAAGAAAGLAWMRRRRKP